MTTEKLNKAVKKLKEEAANLEEAVRNLEEDAETGMPSLFEEEINKTFKEIGRTASNLADIAFANRQ